MRELLRGACQLIADHYTFFERILSTVSCRSLKQPENALREITLVFWKPLMSQIFLKTGLLLLTTAAPSLEPERNVKGWKRKKSVQEYSWPAHSSNLNPIENVWAHLKRHIRSRESQKICRGYSEQNSH